MQIAWRGSEGVQTSYFELEDYVSRRAAHEALLVQDRTLVFHNAKFDLQKLIAAGVLNRDAVWPERIHDTECIMQLLDEHRKKDLKELARTVLGLETNEATVLAKARRKAKLKKEDGLHLLPREVVIPYALKDAEFTLLLFEQLWGDLTEVPDLLSLYESERELIFAVLDMEANGLRVDLERLDQSTKELNTNLLRAQADVQQLTGLRVWFPEKQGQQTPEGCINPNSHVQLLEQLVKRGAPVASTKNEVLKQTDDDLARAIVDLRNWKKLRDYTYAIERERQGEIIHPNFKLFKPRTGRMASGKVEE